MLEGISKRMGEAGAHVAKADAETLWTDIQRMAAGTPWGENEDPFDVNGSVLAATIIRIGEFEGWTVQHTALALAYAYMVLGEDHRKDLMELTTLMHRPMIIHPHCGGCTCKDKSTRYENG